MQAGPLSTNRAPATIISGPGPAVRKDGRVRVKGSTRLVAPSPVATMASCGCSVVTHSSSPRIRYVRAPVVGSVTHVRFFQTDRTMYRSP